MNLDVSKKIPEEFRELAKDFSEKGFITTSFDNLIVIMMLMAGVKGLEPSTYRVTGDRSNQLSYTPPYFGGR